MKKVAIRCANCNRKPRRAPIYVSGQPMGPKCAFMFIGAKPKRGAETARRARDPRQRELFEAAHG
jgi:uracil-DNA glycosylase